MARDYSEYSKDALIAHIQDLERQLKTNKYGLYWDKSISNEDVVNQCKFNIPVLERCEDKCVLRTDMNKTNILIEGDNFHALTSLNMMAPTDGLVDVIYIDPPYNTGGKDFVYNDSYVDHGDGFVHSKWLSFMENRLKLARSIMKDNAAIFISIDDNELANLKLLCNQIFGETNYVGLMTLMSNPRGSQNSNYLSYVHEYILMYAKNISMLETIGVDKDEESLKEFKEIDEDGRRYRLLGLRKRGGDWKKEDRPNMFYPVYINPDTGDCSLEKDDKYTVEVIPKRPTGELSRWTWGKDKFIADNRFLVGKKVRRAGEDDAWDVFRKDYVDSDDGNEKKTKLKTIWTEKDINYQNARNEIKAIFDNSEVFSFPKPTYLVKRVISIIKNNENATILDFFAGSGTTGQAVLNMNAEDGGNRRFILCTNNENNICTEITYPRLKAVITGDKPSGERYDDACPANMMYYKTAFIKDSKNSDQAKYSLVEKVDELLCIVEDTYIPSARTAYYSSYTSYDGKKTMFIYSEYFSKQPFEEFRSMVKAAVGEKVVYVFSTDNNVDEKLFEDMRDVTIKSIPSKIYEIYREVVEDIKRGEQ